MRRVIFHAHTTLDGRIANADGLFWEPFPWAQEEIAYVNELFRPASTWVLGRTMYEAIVPWWRAVAAGNPPEGAGELDQASLDFAEIFRNLDIAVFSRTMPPAEGVTVLNRDPVADLASLKRADGRDIMLSCGPELLAPLAEAAGLIDEYLFAVHPMVLSKGQRVFESVNSDLPLRLVGSKVFEAGAVVLRYAPLAL